MGYPIWWRGLDVGHRPSETSPAFWDEADETGGQKHEAGQALPTALAVPAAEVGTLMVTESGLVQTAFPPTISTRFMVTFMLSLDTSASR